MYSNNTSEIENNDKLFVTSICVATSLISLIVNSSVAFTWLRIKKRRNSFALLSVSLACSDCGVLAVFLFMVAPLTYLQRQDLAFKWPGHISLAFWFSSLYATLAIAINRYVAIAYPAGYEKILSTRRTKKIIIGQWLLAAIHGSLYFFPGCHFVYNPFTFGWYYVETPCYNFMFFIDVIYGIMFVALLFCLNVATGVRLHKHNKKTVKTMSLKEKEKAIRFKKEIAFFVQALINAIVFEFLLLSFHVISRFIEGKFTMFIVTSWMWQISHGTNGFLILCFNRDVRDGVFCRNVQVAPVSPEKGTPKKASQKVRKLQVKPYYDEDGRNEENAMPVPPKNCSPETPQPQRELVITQQMDKKREKVIELSVLHK